ncbi:transposase [Streptomyces sp. NPDC057908]|uniref:transposase n=1 Tax=Streptomyces sp. NPDC057908 TaxID=3346276 RepID=UPI0036E4E724
MGSLARGPQERLAARRICQPRHPPDGLQHLLSRSRWKADELRDDLQACVAEHLGTDNGVLITADTGFVKKGTKSAGVQRQYSGQEGHIRDPCRIDVGRGGPFDERATGKGPSGGTTRRLRRGPPGCV